MGFLVNNKKRYDAKVIDDSMVDVLAQLHIVEPNTGNVLKFDADGYFVIEDPYGKRLKKYKTFEKAIHYMLLNN